MFAGVQRCRHTHAGSQIAGPHTTAYHDIIGINRTVRGINASYPIAIMANFGDLRVFKNLCAASARALGQRLCNVNCIGIAITGDVDSADHVVDIDYVGERLDLFWRHDMDRQIEDLGHGGAAFQFLEPLLVSRHRDRAALPVSSCLPCLCLKPAI